MFERVREGIYKISRSPEMVVDAYLVATPKILETVDKEAIQQLRNATTLPGTVSHVIAMPDIHWGYGFPIGGISATSVTSGVISPGGVGYDINCGVRCLTTPIEFDNTFIKHKEKLLRQLFSAVPSGLGSKGLFTKLSRSEYNSIAEHGVGWAVEKGYGLKEDLDHIEDGGAINNAHPNQLTVKAMERGYSQLGSLGSGNHFIEVSVIKEIFDSDIADKWGLSQNQILIVLHTGSRGLGHQVCTDTLTLFRNAGFSEGLIDKQLIAAPIKSKEGQLYIEAMNFAANYAFTNRALISHQVREVFSDIFKLPYHKLNLLYDLCHNIAKFEKHEIEGKSMELCVHRKGATRAYMDQPVIVPGDMASGTFIMKGLGNPLSFSSCAHGAGREKSRRSALKTIDRNRVMEDLKSRDISIMAQDRRTIVEEAPACYKELNDVVDSVVAAGLASKVAYGCPVLVIKG